MLKNIRSRNFGEEGGKGDLEISRFYWVFLNDGLPKLIKGQPLSFIKIFHAMYAIHLFLAHIFRSDKIGIYHI